MTGVNRFTVLLAGNDCRYMCPYVCLCVFVFSLRERERECVCVCV